MDPQRPFPRWRETFLALTLAVGLACLIVLYFLLIGGQYFLAVLAVLGGMILLIGLQYLLWGWPRNRHPSPPPWKGHRPQ